MRIPMNTYTSILCSKTNVNHLTLFNYFFGCHKQEIYPLIYPINLKVEWVNFDFFSMNKVDQITANPLIKQ